MNRRRSMKRTAGKVAWGAVTWALFVWVCVPAALFFVGFKFVGPRIGQVPSLNATASTPALPVKTDTPKPAHSSPAPATEKFGKPIVEVTVEKSAGRDSSRERDAEAAARRARPATAERTKPEAPPVERPEGQPKDEASGDVAATPVDPPPEEPTDPASTTGGG